MKITFQRLKDLDYYFFAILEQLHSPFIHLFNKHVLRTYFITRTILGAWELYK